MEIKKEIIEEKMKTRKYILVDLPKFQLQVRNTSDLENLTRNAFYDYYGTKYTGFKGFIKRIIRKFCKPIVLPLVEQQNSFNNEVIKTLKDQQERIEALEDYITVNIKNEVK